jgi:hypothetical protein
MKVQEKISSLFSPLDVVVIENEYQELIEASSEPNIPKKCENDISVILGTGDFPSRNPTCWRLFQDEPIEINSPVWVGGICNYFRVVNEFQVSPVDNQKNHLLFTVKFEILVINAKSLPDEIFKGAKCVSVQTNLGTFPIKSE